MKNLKLAFLFPILLLSVSLFAHPASNMTLTFDPVEHILTISIDHAVKNPKDHFIKEIVVKLNNKVIITQKFQSQDNTLNASAIYKIIDANIGDYISVTSKCNKFGKKTKKIKIHNLDIKKR